MKYFNCATIICCFLLIIGCTDSECIDIQEYDSSINEATSTVFKDIIEKYHEKDTPTNNEEMTERNDIYIDLSDGITKYALSNQNNKNLFQNFLYSISNQNDINHYFELSDNDIIEYTGDSQIQYFTETGHYTNKGKLKRGAPLDKAIQKISGENNLSILVTDGELYDNDLKKISMEMWASESLTNWFTKGNELSIIYSNFTESNNGRTYKKHMYLMFFVPRDYNGALLSNFISDLESNSSIVYEKMDFSIQPKNLYTRKYPNSQLPGASKFLEDFDPNPGAYFSDNSFEYIDLTNGDFSTDPDGEGIVKYLRDIGDENGRAKNFPLLEKLFFDFKKFPNYKVKKINLEASNISSDFIDFKRNYYAKLATPSILKDSNGKDSLNIDNYLEFDLCIGLVDGEPAYDLMEKTQEDTVDNFRSMLYDNFKYPISNSRIIEVKDLVDIDETAGKVNEINDEDGEYEILIKFSPKLNDQSLGLYNDQNNLIRIDVILEELELNPLDREALTWNKISEDGIDETLYRSISNTLKTIAPTGKSIYTYYIEFGAFNN